MGDDLYLIDTNILVYNFDNSEKIKHEKTLKILDLCWKKEAKYAISTQNLSEFFTIVTEKITNPLSKKEAKNIIQKIIELSNFIILEIKPKTIISAINISEKYGIKYWDALIAATMKENQIFNIYTEDKDFKKIPWLNVVNPF